MVTVTGLPVRLRVMLRLVPVEGLIEDANQGQTSLNVEDAEEARDALQSMRRYGSGRVLGILPLAVDVLRRRI